MASCGLVCLVSLSIRFVLILGILLMLREAILQFFNLQPVKVEGMLLLAVLGFLFNELAVLRLKNKKSINQKVVYLHLLEDVLGWIAVFVGALYNVLLQCSLY